MDSPLEQQPAPEPGWRNGLVSAQQRLNMHDPQVMALAGAVVRGYTHPMTERLTVDTELVWAVVVELMRAGAYIPDRLREPAL